MAKASKPGSQQVREFDPSQVQRPGVPILELDPATIHDRRPTAPTLVEDASAISVSDDFFKARDALQRHLGDHPARLKARAAARYGRAAGAENILGYGVGLRVASGRLTGDVAAKVYVREKLPVSRLDPSSLAPQEINGLAVDVEAVGDVTPYSYTARFARPVPCGVSISNITLPGSGTLGCLVVLNSGHLCILSNNHVMANENTSQIGDAIIQPGNAERVPAADEVIGSLLSYVPIQASGNWVDAAIAWTNFALVSPWHVSYKLNPQAVPQAASLGLTVIKNGRTTQATIGVVTDLGVNISVPYTPFPGGAEMINQIAIKGIGGTIFSTRGDSGSLITAHGTKNPVALLFAGSSDSTVTYANRLDAVMTAFGINYFVAPPA